MEYNFGEKKQEYSQKQGKNIPVWISEKYQESKKKACEMIASGKYGLTPADFWILMNETKTGKMGYTGLIISHNGCLKINDKLESPFNPASVIEDKAGYGGALVFTYCNEKQGIYEVGEVTAKNCKNDYPYAMAFKRLFDRVVLKLSKLAYSGIYSEVESDSFRDPIDDTRRNNEQPTQKEPDEQHVSKKTISCQRCGKPIMGYNGKAGKFTVEQIVELSTKSYHRRLCWNCMKAVKKAQAEQAQAEQAHENAG